MPSVRNARDLGVLIRERRKLKGLTQHDLAAKVGVSRDWVIALERGHSNPQLNHLLGALTVLDLDLAVGTRNAPATGRFDLDSVLASHRA